MKIISSIGEHLDSEDVVWFWSFGVDNKGLRQGIVRAMSTSEDGNTVYASIFEIDSPKHEFCFSCVFGQQKLLVQTYLEGYVNGLIFNYDKKSNKLKDKINEIAVSLADKKKKSKLKKLLKLSRKLQCIEETLSYLRTIE